MAGDKKPLIGVFAIQGAVEEHCSCARAAGADVVEIREPHHFEGIEGIILPGGESTAMAIVGDVDGLFPILKKWVQDKKPIWGTCAGMILLSDHAIKTKEGGQSLVGGLDAYVCRNYFGSQIDSCELTMQMPTNLLGLEKDEKEKCNAIFIRAPAILKAGPAVDVLATVTAKPHVWAKDEVVRLLDEESGSVGKKRGSPGGSAKSPSKKRKAGSEGDDDAHKIATGSQAKESETTEGAFEVMIAVKQGNILATAFHPELTEDLRWHRYFVDMVKQCS